MIIIVCLLVLVGHVIYLILEDSWIGLIILDGLTFIVIALITMSEYKRLNSK